MKVLEAHLKPFNVLLTNMVDGPVNQTVMVTQIDELQFVIRHLEALRRYLAVMIEDWSGTLNLYLTSEENERTIASMTRMNDMICKLRDKYLRAYDEMGFGDTTMLATRQIATAGTAGFPPARSGPVTAPSRGTIASFTSPSRSTSYTPRGTVAGIRVAPSRRHFLSFIAQLLDVVEDLLERSQVLLKETEDDSLYLDQILEGGVSVNYNGISHTSSLSDAF
ncbi:unnamed protein product [Dibothriocephalus latus]|uniref:Uncharacterized protein n=1 Tax=Dibothriocephalus latus TaxID=60516 RepID=A0A3P7NP81_DIBLA|nr:unnamed protein product [Dibothriocephalus latus]